MLAGGKNCTSNTRNNIIIYTSSELIKASCKAIPIVNCELNIFWGYTFDVVVCIKNDDEVFLCVTSSRSLSPCYNRGELKVTVLYALFCRNNSLGAKNRLAGCLMGF